MSRRMNSRLAWALLGLTLSTGPTVAALPPTTVEAKGCAPNSAPPANAILAAYYYGRAVGLLGHRRPLLVLATTTSRENLVPGFGGLFLATRGPARTVADATRIVEAAASAPAVAPVRLPSTGHLPRDVTLQLTSGPCPEEAVCAEFSSVLPNPFSSNINPPSGVIARLAHARQNGVWLWVQLYCDAVTVAHVSAVLDLRIAED